jgi:hypothetical protein
LSVNFGRNGFIKSTPDRRGPREAEGEEAQAAREGRRRPEEEEEREEKEEEQGGQGLVIGFSLVYLHLGRGQFFHGLLIIQEKLTPCV